MIGQRNNLMIEVWVNYVWIDDTSWVDVERLVAIRGLIFRPEYRHWIKPPTRGRLLTPSGRSLQGGGGRGGGNQQ